MNHRKKIIILDLFVFLSLILQTAFSSEVSSYLDDFEKRMTEFTLDNGMKFLVLERHDAPVVSFQTYVDVGSVNEVTGITGISHIFEHMAFKGTSKIGSTNFKAESKAMDKIEKTFIALKDERLKGDKADKVKLEQLEQQFKDAQQEADKYIAHDQFEKILESEGASGLNAYTGDDATCYISSLPSNKLELWMYMESNRFYDPVLREFYKELNVIKEERRMGENYPTRKLLEDFLSIGFKAHPYGEPVIGHMSDLNSISMEDASAYHEKYYIPANMTAAIVGDVDPEKVKELAKIYFGRLPKEPKPEPVTTIEPPQEGERRVVLQEESQPLLLIGYHIPSFNNPDNVILETLANIISSGRTSRLYKSMVKEKKMAVSVTGMTDLPGDKYPALFIFFVNPSRDHTNQECEEEIYSQLEKLKTEPVSEDELKKARTSTKANLFRNLEWNSDLASQLNYFQVITGDWRNLFRRAEAIENVTAEDIQRVAKQYFTVQNRTVGCIETKKAQ